MGIIFLSLQMSFCYRKQRGREGAWPERRGRGVGGAGRINVEIAVSNKLEMDFDWLLQITAPGICVLLLNVPLEEVISVQTATHSHTQMEF